MAISVMVSSWRPMFSSLPQSQSKPSNPIFNGFVGSLTENKRNVVVCSSRPQKKGTKHHMNTRPKKIQPWEINRRPTVYAPLPPLPPDWSLDPNQSKVPSFSIAEEQTVSRTS